MTFCITVSLCERACGESGKIFDQRRKSRWTELAKTSAWRTRDDCIPNLNQAIDAVFPADVLIGLSSGIRSANKRCFAASKQISLLPALGNRRGGGDYSEKYLLTMVN